MNKKSIVLIGFMGVGKTTIGLELAKSLEWPFLDSDAEIEKIYKMPTNDIFKKHGEKTFRKTEKEFIVEACKQEGKVISVGGGAFMNKDIQQACMEYANVVFLDLSWEHWKDRVSILIDTRPILQGKTLEDMKELFLERQDIYKEHHIKVKLDHLTVENAAEKVINELERL